MQSMSSVSICPPTRASDVMSINAITSSDPKNVREYTSFTENRKNYILSKASVQELLKPIEPTPPVLMDAVNHRTGFSDRRFESLDMMPGNEIPIRHMRNIPEQTTTTFSSPSLSATSVSDANSDLNSSGSQHSLPHTPNWSFSANDIKTLYINHVSETVAPLNNFTNFSNIKSQSKNLLGYLSALEENANFQYREDFSAKRYEKKNGAGLATRRARNKVASAKYRAKKQALTHAMQDRIMQLATQVVSLNNELLESKKRESQTQEKYKRLVMALRHNNYFKESNKSPFHHNLNRAENSSTSSLLL